MPATLGARLVFHVHRGHACFDERFHRAGNVKRPTPARVYVHQHGQFGGIGDAIGID